MIFFLTVLALIWGLPIIAALLVVLASSISPHVKGVVREVLFGSAT